jgi:5-keto-L-gluconate epimerase
MAAHMNLAVSACVDAPPGAPFVLRGDVRNALQLAAKLGYDGIELHLRVAGDIDRETVRELARGYGLRVANLGTGMAAGVDGLTFTHDDPAVRQHAVDRVREHIELAEYLGACGVTIGKVADRVGADPARRPTRRGHGLECLDAVCRLAAPAGLDIFLGALNRYESDWGNTLDDVLRIVDELGHPNLKVLADTFHMNIEEADIAASLRRTGSKLGHVHLVDTNREAPGHGHLDLPAVLGALRDIDYAGFLAFEILPLPGPEMAAADAIRAVRDAEAAL